MVLTNDVLLRSASTGFGPPNEGESLAAYVERPWSGNVALALDWLAAQGREVLIWGGHSQPRAAQGVREDGGCPLCAPRIVRLMVKGTILSVLTCRLWQSGPPTLGVLFECPEKRREERKGESRETFWMRATR